MFTCTKYFKFYLEPLRDFELLDPELRLRERLFDLELRSVVKKSVNKTSMSLFHESSILDPLPERLRLRLRLFECDRDL